MRAPLREFSDFDHVEVRTHVHSYTAPYLSTPVDLTGYLDDVVVPSVENTYRSKARGISALGGERRPSIFDKGIDTICPTPKTKEHVDPLTGEITEEIRYYWSPWHRSWMPARCGRVSCRACSIYKARRAAGAIYLSRPTHVSTFTLVGTDRAEINKLMANLFTELRKTYPTLRYAWTAEWNPRNTGAHVHAYLHLADPDISQTVVDRSSSRVGAGSVHLMAIPETTSVLYFGYIFKDLADRERRGSFLQLNGEHTLVHSSKSGMWRDGSDGPTIRSRAQAESLALRRSR